MSDKRRAFLKSLSPAKPPATPGPTNQPEVGSLVGQPSARREQGASSTPSAEEVSARKRYISKLSCPVTSGQPDPDSDPGPRDTPGKGDVGKGDVAAVAFTLEGLLAFRDTASGIMFGKTAAESRAPARKRPNYNGTNRRLLAKMTDRVRFLYSIS